MSTISVVIPVFNVEKYLRRCLDSVLAQTCADWQAICVNDGSTDGSLAILQEYAQKDSRFQIIDKPNGGVSESRNIGVAHADSEYIVFLDSDDFIHPQTMELALALARRDGSDMVSWYKDPLFRPQLLLRHKLGLSIDNAVPPGIKKRYRLEDVKSCYTEDVYAHATERSHSGIKWPIKHTYVWRYLMKRELIKDVEFIKGITFEELSWWAEVMLKHPKITITQLPFYYYFPNFNSIDLGSKASKKIRDWMHGLEVSYRIYLEKANEYEMRQWTKEFVWPVLIYQIFRKIRKVEDAAEIEEFRQRLAVFQALGMLEKPPGKSEARYKAQIEDFIRTKSL